MKSHYETKLKEGKCWRAFRDCPLGKKFLEALYSWSEQNPLNPWLAWKICDPCEFEGDCLRNFVGMKIGVYGPSGELDKIVTVVSMELEGEKYKPGTLTAKLDDGKEITADVCSFVRWLQNSPSFLGWKVSYRRVAWQLQIGN